MKILIGYDGSDCADAAIFDLKRAGLPGKAQAIVLAVADLWSLGTYLATDYPQIWQQTQEMIDEEMKAARARAAKGKAAVQYYFPHWQIEAATCAHSPGTGLLEKAAEWRPDLLVLGSHGRSAFGRILFGSVSQKVLSEAPCNVRIARGQIQENVSPPRLILGLDGSRSSDYALEELVNRSWPKGTAVHLVTAADVRLRMSWMLPNAAITPWIEQEDDEPLAWVRRMIAAYKIQLETAGLVVSSILREGEPQDVLLAESVKWGADTVFLGAKGLNADEQGHVGRVAAAVAARAHCAVEVVRALPSWSAADAEQAFGSCSRKEK